MTNGKLKHTTRAAAKKVAKGKRAPQPKKPATKPSTQGG